MLNRRTLRIKIMQTLFAFEQCREANHQLAQDLILQRFAPDLNSMEVQDKTLLKTNGKMAISLYLQKPEHADAEQASEEAVPLAVAQAVADARKFYSDQSEKDCAFLKKNLLVEITGINALYRAVLALLLEFATLAGEDKKMRHQPFVENAIISALRSHKELEELLRKEQPWKNERTRVADWFRNTVKTDDQYITYNQTDTPDIEAQRAIIKHMVRHLILSGVVNDYLAGLDIRWAEDHHIVKSLVDRTLKSFQEDAGTMQLQKLSMDWEDDLVFMDILFDKTVNLGADSKDLIAKNTRNWEVDRLPLTDRVILEMAIAEMIHFPGIPVKVSINEYIELAKAYSTPKSSQFVNGILDVMAKEMQEQGIVKKSGRGLIDNK